jgi:hypothetical protein
LPSGARLSSGEHRAGRFRRDERLELQQVDDSRFDELGFGQRRGHAQDRFVGENTEPSGIAWTSPVKRKFASLSRKSGRTRPRRASHSSSSGRNRSDLEVAEHLFQAGGHKIPARRQLPREELEDRRLLQAFVVVPCIIVN